MLCSICVRLPTTSFPRESRTLCYLHEGLGLAVAGEAASLLTFTIPQVADTSSLAPVVLRHARDSLHFWHVTLNCLSRSGFKAPWFRPISISIFRIYLFPLLYSSSLQYEHRRMREPAQCALILNCSLPLLPLCAVSQSRLCRLE